MRWTLTFLPVALALGCGGNGTVGGDVNASGDAGTPIDSGGSVHPDSGLDAGLDSGLDGGLDAGPDAGSDAGQADATAEGGSAYGIFQLYGDEYKEFNQQMGFTLQDYWDFVDRHVAMLHVSFTRTNTLFIWGLVEPTVGGGYVWDTPMKTDMVVRAVYAPAPGKQMDILLVIEPGRGSRGDAPYPTGLEAEYQDFVRAVVERYDGDGRDDADANVRAKHWQVMNEPFFALDSGTLTEGQYVDLVKLTSQAVREADPQAKVVLGDVGPHLKGILPALANGGFFDAIDIHYWSGGAGYQLQNLDKVRAGLDANGYAGVGIWMCEFGSARNIAQGPAPAQTASEQARWLVKAMVANRAGGVTRILWNNLVGWSNFGGDPNSQFNFMGLISSGAASGDDPSLLGKETVAYYAFERLVAETDTAVADLVGEMPSMPAGVRAFQWTPHDGSHPFFIAWTDQGTVHADLSCPTPGAKVVTLVPDDSGTFVETSVASSGGLVSIDVGLDPVLVRPVE